MTVHQGFNAALVLAATLSRVFRSRACNIAREYMTNILEG
jgi:hypothetical protein